MNTSAKAGDVNSKPAWTRDPEVLGGEPVFAGTRVPVRSLFDHLEGGDSLDDFLEGFPSVTRAQAIAVLEDCWRSAADADPARRSSTTGLDFVIRLD